MAKLVAYMERPDGRVQEYLDQLFASIGNTSSSLLFYYYYIFLFPFSTHSYSNVVLHQGPTFIRQMVESGVRV